MTDPILYRYETKGIQKWILGGQQLRDLAGGSALVESLAEVAANWALQAGADKILQATAGAMTARFPDRQTLEKFAELWPMALDDWAPGLQIVQAWVDEADGLESLHRKLAVRRNLPEVNILEAGPWVLRTGRSGEPAVPHHIRSDARSGLQDATAVAKERAYLSARRKPGLTTGHRGWESFVTDVDAWPDSTVAVIHADGSGIGRALLRLARDPDGLVRFSEALAKVTEHALEQALEALPKRGDRYLARPIVAAGDDLTYMVPAHAARGFVSAWLGAFHAGSVAHEEVLGEPLYAGAGIMMVHRHFPFAQAYDMAETLCSSVKRAARESANPASNVFAIQRLTTSLTQDLEDRALGWRVNEDGGAPALDELVRAVRLLPRGTLRRWLTAFEAGQVNDARTLWERAREVADARIWRQFEAALRQAGASPINGHVTENGPCILPLSQQSFVTPIRDALALAHIEMAAAHGA